MLEIVLRQRARDDLKSIWRHTHDEWGARQADRYLTEIGETMERLALQPGLGTRRDAVRPGYRAMPCGRHMIFYTVADGVLQVVRVLHERMDIGRQRL